MRAKRLHLWYLTLIGLCLGAALGCGAEPQEVSVVQRHDALELPSAWEGSDVGSPASAGSSSYSSAGGFTISGAGTGVTNWYRGNPNIYWDDQFHFVKRDWEHDVEIVARIDSVSMPLAQAGLALRESASPSARNVSIFFSPQSSSPLQIPTIPEGEDVVQSTARTVDGVQPMFSLARVVHHRPKPAAMPIWLKLVRVGQDVGAYWSRDGEVWIPSPSGGVIVAEGAIQVGMYVSSSDPSALATAQFSEVYVGPPRLTHRTSWVGNTFNQPSKGNIDSYLADGYVTSTTEALWVNPDGTAWTNNYWDESGQSSKIYAEDANGNPKVVRTLSDSQYFGNHTSREGSITGDGTFVYVYLNHAAVGGHYIRRADANGDFDAEMSLVTPVASISGMAASGTNHELYLADAINDQILVVDTNTNAEIPERRFTFSQGRPGPMALDHAGNLWIIQEGTDYPMSTARAATHPTGVFQYTKDGVFTGKSITDVAFPTALAVRPQFPILLVADNGPNQNIRRYSLLGQQPTFLGTFGVTGGVHAGPTPGLLEQTNPIAQARFQALSGLGFDAAGNLYVAGNGNGTDLRKFDRFGRFKWALNASLDAFGSGDFDPATDGQDLFTRSMHYELDYSQTQPGAESTLKGITYDPLSYPNDQRRLGASVTYVRRIEGRRFLFVAQPHSVDLIGIYRFDGPEGNGETAIPCGELSSIPWVAPSNFGTTSLWIDANGDGERQPQEVTTVPSPNYSNGAVIGPRFDVDSEGTIWWPNRAIVRLTPQGINSIGAPIYSLTGPGYAEIPYPAPFTPHPQNHAAIEGITYDREQDAMYLSGNTATHESLSVGIGAVLARYDDWSVDQGNAPPRYVLRLPSPETDFDFYYQPPWGAFTPFIKSFDVAGDYVFTWDLFTQVRVYDARLGNPVVSLAPGPEVGGVIAWTDPVKAHAFQRSTGEYLLTMEDSGWNARNLLYRWTPADAEHLPAAPVNLEALGDNDGVHLSWQGPRGQLLGYNVYRTPAAGGEPTLIAAGVEAPTYHDATTSVGQAYDYGVSALTAVGEGPQSATSTGHHLTSNAVFIGDDTTTRGDWLGVYGAGGHWTIDPADYFQPVVLSPSSTLRYTGLFGHVATLGTQDERALLLPDGSGEREMLQLFKYEYPSFALVPFDVELRLADGQTHQVALYVCDFNRYGLSEEITVRDAVTGATLASQSISNFQEGKYVLLQVSGHVTLTFSPTAAGWFSTLSGVFLD